MGDPDSMNAARNSPSVFPSFTNIWIETEIDPALSPQLEDVSRVQIKRYFTYIVTFDGSPPND